MKKLFINTETKGAVLKDEQRLLSVIGSNGIIDRHGESVNPNGWILDNYKTNPVILYGHDYHALPVGKAERVWIEDNKLMFDIKFAETDFAKEVFSLFADGFLKTFSVGFIPNEYGTSGVDEYTIMKQELLELSVVTVPANPEALINSKSMDEFNSLQAKLLKLNELVVKEGEEVAKEEVVEEVKEEIKEEAKNILVVDVKELTELLEGILNKYKIVEIKEVEKIVEVAKEDEKVEVVEEKEVIKENDYTELKSIRDMLRKSNVSTGLSVRALNRLLELQSSDNKGGEQK